MNDLLEILEYTTRFAMNEVAILHEILVSFGLHCDNNDKKYRNTYVLILL